LPSRCGGIAVGTGARINTYIKLIGLRVVSDTAIASDHEPICSTRNVVKNEQITQVVIYRLAVSYRSPSAENVRKDPSLATSYLRPGRTQLTTQGCQGGLHLDIAGRAITLFYHIARWTRVDMPQSFGVKATLLTPARRTCARSFPNAPLRRAGNSSQE
jgi:hypothetical protein